MPRVEFAARRPPEQRPTRRREVGKRGRGEESPGNSGLEKSQGLEAAVKCADGVRFPPPLEHTGVEIAEIHRKRQVPVSIEPRQGGRLAVETALDAAAEHEMRARRAVIG